MTGPFTRVDSSQVQTQAGREIAKNINAGMELLEAKINRFVHVMQEYLLYKRSAQLNLADAAIMLAFSALAKSDPNDECKKNFEAIIDMMYVHTDDAMLNRNESEREHNYAEAASTHQSVLARVHSNLRTCLGILTALSKNDPYRLCAEMLYLLQPDILDHAPPDSLCELIPRCVALYSSVECVRRGIEPESYAHPEIGHVCQAAAKVSAAVVDAIKDGKLIVIDGKIFNRCNDA